MNAEGEGPGLSYYLCSALSGGVWELIAYFLGHRAVGPTIWGGVLASPLVGLFVGWAGQRFGALLSFKLGLVSLVSLYVSAALFGLATGLYDFAIGHKGRVLSEVIFGPVLWVPGGSPLPAM